MKTTALVSPLSSPSACRAIAARSDGGFSGFYAFALAVIVTLLASLAVPRAFAQEQPAADPDQAASAENTTALPVVSRLVYLPQLPTAASLQKEAAASGASIVRLDRTDDSVVVIYQHADGRTENVGYTILSPDSTREEPAVVATPIRPAPEITVVSAPPPTIIYRERAPVYYETRYYDRADNFWAPLALGFGLGYISHGHGTNYRGYGRGYSFHRGGHSSGGRRR
ncbi:MAG: hypothetical protein PSV13_05995 [Lacunisphaera sp.]|nr:hypothetical protein [Lacunisphaera sp.]